ncbi:MAG: hypothetical protein JO345_05745 [Streptosporangiaceae bacterium]|nr:hypothetical protein [Streptosporangiaceae bacterium]
MPMVIAILSLAGAWLVPAAAGGPGQFNAAASATSAERPGRPRSASA